MKLDQIRATYDRLAPTYDTTVGLTERFLVGDLRQAFGAALKGDTLEVGIGSGLNLPFYSDAVTSVIGVDLSLEMLRAAALKTPDLPRPVSLAQMDAQHLAFRDGQFDTVAISLALCTVPDPVAALREMIRVCRPDGRLVLLEHVLSPIWPIALLERLWNPVQQRTLGCSLTRRTFDTARDLGITIDAERSRFFGVFRLAVGRPPVVR